MLRLHRLKAATLVAALFPVFAYCDVETLVIQIGKDQAALDTVTIQADYGKLPEVDQPEGHAWADQEKDSAWTDSSGRHYGYNHSFAATLGSRKGFGSDYATVDDNGTGTPTYSAGILFTFPGDTTILYSWEPAVHMNKLPDAYPHSETEFVSGYPQHGTVILRNGSGGANLAEGEWARLLTRKRERPASANKPVAFPGKETLRIQIGKGKQLLDTVVIWTQYDAPPEITEPTGRKWSDLEKDTAWSDSQGWNLRYTHSFLAQKGSRKGYGTDYIYLVDNPEDFIGTPHYTASLSLSFPGDTSETYSWEPEHMVDVPEAYPYDKTRLIDGSESYADVLKTVINGSENLTEGQWALLLTRENGWVDYQSNVLSRRSNRGGRMDGWLVNLVPGARLPVPPGAKAMRIFDVQGRVQFEIRNLVEGATVALPQDAPRKALRIQWQTGPG
jgi:hypothetical protein